MGREKSCSRFVVLSSSSSSSLTSFPLPLQNFPLSLLRGEPAAVLRALRFVFNRYPRTLERCATAAAVGGGACCASEEDAAVAASLVAAGNNGSLDNNNDSGDAPCSSSSPISSAGRALLSPACPPSRFATAAVRALRHGLGIERVGMTPAQLLERVRRKRRRREFGVAVFFSFPGRETDARNLEFLLSKDFKKNQPRNQKSNPGLRRAQAHPDCRGRDGCQGARGAGRRRGEEGLRRKKLQRRRRREEE